MKNVAVCRILLVEDARIVREPLARLLATEGFDVISAADGNEAMAALQGGEGRAGDEAGRSAEVDLILLDVHMPRMDGVAFLSALRADARLCHVPVIGLTGVSDTSRMTRLRELGVVTILHKLRFTFDGLLDEIRAVLPAPHATPVSSRC